MKIQLDVQEMYNVGQGLDINKWFDLGVGFFDSLYNITKE